MVYIIGMDPEYSILNLTRSEEKNSKNMIRITRTFAIPDHEIDEKFIQSSGPGGQNVNKVATAVQLRFNIDDSNTLPQSVKHRLKRLAHNQITTEGELIIEARDHRTQERNRKAVREKFAHLIRKALKPQRQRKKTKPTHASDERRLESKHIHARKKKHRQDPPLPK